MNELKALRQGIDIAIKNGVFVMEDVVSLKVAFDRLNVLVEKGLAAELGETPKIPADSKTETVNLKKR